MNIFNIRNKIFRFAGIGVLNTGTDFLIFNLLVFSFGVSILYAFSLWKTISSLIAATQSYFLHKYITFENKELINTKQVTWFFVITFSSFLLNLATSTFIFYSVEKYFHTMFATNIAWFCGICVGLLFNYFGYDRIVFKKNK